MLKLFGETKNNLVRDDEINLLVTLVLMFFLVNIYFYYVNSFFGNELFPRNTFLPNGVTRFGDFYGLYDQWKRMSFAGVGYGLSYFPATYLFAEVLTWIKTPQQSLLFAEFIFLTFFLIYTYKNIKTKNVIDSLRNVVILTFTSYPVLFAWHTGNIEFLLFIFLVLFVFFYKNGRTSLSVIPLGLAIGMKLFPLVFVIIYIKDKKYKDIFRLLIVVCIATLIPLLLFKGGILDGPGKYISNLRESQKMYAELMVIGGAGMHFGHSLINGCRAFFGGSFPSMLKVMTPYLFFSLFVFALISIYIVKYKPVLWRSVTLLVISMCLLPYTSTDYKLIHFFIPLYLYINKSEELNKFERLLFISLFVLLIVPKSFCYFNGDIYSTLNIVLNPIVMIILLVSVICSNGFKKAQGIFHRL